MFDPAFIEQSARALYDAAPGGPPWDDTSERIREWFRQEIRDNPKRCNETRKALLAHQRKRLRGDREALKAMAQQPQEDKR